MQYVVLMVKWFSNFPFAHDRLSSNGFEAVSQNFSFYFFLLPQQQQQQTTRST